MGSGSRLLDTDLVQHCGVTLSCTLFMDPTYSFLIEIATQVYGWPCSGVSTQRTRGNVS